MAKYYRGRKQEFDDMVYGYLLKRLREPMDRTDAFCSGRVDEFGNALGKTNDWAYTKLDALLFRLRAKLGNAINDIEDTYGDVDTLSLMNGSVDPTEYKRKYTPVVSLVEEASYLPPEQRGFDGIISEESDMTMPERISFAMTVATYLLYCIKLDRIPTQPEFDKEVLAATEGTFGIRSLGSCQDIESYLRKSKLINGRNLENHGYLLAVRIAKVVAANNLCQQDINIVDNLSRDWAVLSRAG